MMAEQPMMARAGSGELHCSICELDGVIDGLDMSDLGPFREARDVQAVRKRPSSTVHSWTTIPSTRTPLRGGETEERDHGDIHFKAGFGRDLCGGLQRHRRRTASAECSGLAEQQLQ